VCPAGCLAASVDRSLSRRGYAWGRLQPDAVVNLAYLIGCYKLVSPLLP
jgi:hypothetical protein